MDNMETLIIIWFLASFALLSYNIFEPSLSINSIFKNLGLLPGLLLSLIYLVILIPSAILTSVYWVYYIFIKPEEDII